MRKVLSSRAGFCSNVAPSDKVNIASRDASALFNPLPFSSLNSRNDGSSSTRPGPGLSSNVSEAIVTRLLNILTPTWGISSREHSFGIGADQPNLVNAAARLCVNNSVSESALPIHATSTFALFSPFSELNIIGRNLWPEAVAVRIKSVSSTFVRSWVTSSFMWLASSLTSFTRSCASPALASAALDLASASSALEEAAPDLVLASPAMVFAEPAVFSASWANVSRDRIFCSDKASFRWPYLYANISHITAIAKHSSPIFSSHLATFLCSSAKWAATSNNTSNAKKTSAAASRLLCAALTESSEFQSGSNVRFAIVTCVPLPA